MVDLDKFVLDLNNELNEKFDLATTKKPAMVKVAKIFLDNVLTSTLENIQGHRYHHMGQEEAKVTTDYIKKLKTYLGAL
jgi:hypothetical protein